MEFYGKKCDNPIKIHITLLYTENSNRPDLNCDVNIVLVKCVLQVLNVKTALLSEAPHVLPSEGLYVKDDYDGFSSLNFDHMVAAPACY